MPLAIDSPSPAPTTSVVPADVRLEDAPGQRGGDAAAVVAAPRSRRCRRPLLGGSSPRRRPSDAPWVTAFSSRLTSTCSRRSWSAQTGSRSVVDRGRGSSLRRATQRTAASTTSRRSHQSALQPQAARLDRGRVEQVADEALQAGRLGGDRAQEPLGRLDVPRQVGLAQGRRVALDGGQRRAELVAERREQLALDGAASGAARPPPAGPPRGPRPPWRGRASGWRRRAARACRWRPTPAAGRWATSAARPSASRRATAGEVGGDEPGAAVVAGAGPRPPRPAAGRRSWRRDEPVGVARAAERSSRRPARRARRPPPRRAPRLRARSDAASPPSTRSGPAIVSSIARSASRIRFRRDTSASSRSRSIAAAA